MTSGIIPPMVLPRSQNNDTYENKELPEKGENKRRGKWQFGEKERRQEKEKG